ncbi:Protein of unknown function [Flexibacter flexilis DSM 6793]|uniref:DUF3667 domain-containing protein n=1 Tax=Flexibacter flexilis DSM 6793 TaxID=927664 RepID=A0A1I1IUB9_9BACT|nr:DUF3667 domain-containing protein [Flexibacter flexilis]SFC37323.1 Protein of unknown function [Flexibacter flexilis DSM 6793]
MKTRRKTDHCLNCGFQFEHDENYCPQCGQENNDKTVSVRVLASEIAEEALNLDSRVFRSLFPFFFKPGFLAVEFNAGRRVNYVAPLRLYLIASFLYFFTLSYSPNQGFLDNVKEGVKTSSDTTAKVLEKIDLAQKKKRKADSLARVSEKQKNPKVKTQTDELDLDLGVLKGIPLHGIRKTISADSLLDSLKIEKTFMTRVAAKQAIHISKEDGVDSYLNTVRENLSIAMILLIPLMAWLLKLLYIRRKTLYVQHFVFVLYTQAFVFFALFFLASLEYIDFLGKIEEFLSIAIWVIIPVYIVLAMRRMYGQSWTKTIFKMGIFSYFFLIMLFISFIFDLMVAFFLF